jgi:paraquat-inducible protein A
LKIISMLLLVVTIRTGRLKKGRAWIYKTIQVVDPWNMLEVYALAIVVAIVELGKVATIHPGAGALSFGCVVFLTAMATLAFDPRLIWEMEESHHADPD